MQQTKTRSFSDFWIRGQMSTATNKNSIQYIMQLASAQRAITNFVKIVTNRSDINVRYATSGDSYTDGKTITISADATKPTDFDPVVGLALHEASHIKLTDFSLLKVLNKNPKRLLGTKKYTDLQKKHSLDSSQTNTYIKSRLHTITNVIEDRRIDHYIFTTAPGYLGYYKALYDKYFNSKKVDKALIKKQFTSETWDDYLFHIINMVNKNRDLNALQKWKEIWNLIGLKNIDRLQDTKAVYDLGVKIFNIIEDQVPPIKMSSQIEQNFNDLIPGSGNGTTPTDSELRELIKDLVKQKKLILDQTNKTQTTPATADAVKAMESGKVVHTKTGSTGSAPYTIEGSNDAKVDTYVIKDLTMQIIKSGMFPMLTDFNSNNLQYIKQGIILGTMLGNKLQVRNDVRTTTTTRQEHGKIDKRLVNSLGYANEKVFFNSITEQYNAAQLHISIDASGSMSGNRWANTMTAVVAICKACSMVGNVGVTVNFRYEHNDNPLVVMAYDSRKDKFSKINTVFPYLSADGSTPESLCYEALRNVLNTEKVQKGVDNYFINFSDGQPWFSTDNFTFSGNMARQHCAKEINLLKRAGYKVLSYLIDSKEMGSFRQMYGKDAVSIDVTQLLPLAKTLNEMLKTKPQ